LDPPRDPDEPDVRPWPPAWRLIFLLVVGAAGWVLVVVLAAFVRRRLGL
jgi:hypothetical protein